jgi:hypothetical protein
LPQVQEKFVQNLSGIFAQERAKEIIDRIGDLENLTTIQQLTNLLRTN